MAHPLDTEGRKARRLDPLAWAAAAFLGVAIMFAAYPAFRAGPATMGGLLLLLGIAGVAFFAILAMRGVQDRQSEISNMAVLLGALSEPAVVASSDGRVLEANVAWDDAVGLGVRLPKSVQSGALFSALSAARRGHSANAALRIGDEDRDAQISRLGERRFLVRLIPRAERVESEVLAVALDPPPTKSDAATPVAATALDAFAAAAPFGAALLDGPDPLTATIMETNPAIRALTGGRDLTGASLASLIEPQSLVEAAARIAAGRSGPVEVRLAHDTQRIGHLYLTRNGDGFIAYLVDVSEQKQVELQLSQSEKMRAIGQLAGGVAHDFNNLLTAIQLRLDELLQRHSVGDPSHEGLMEIRQTSIRAADLVRKLLTHARKQTVQRQTLELGELISEIEVLLRRVLREDVKLETDYGRNLPLVRADKSELETAVMNLAVNARDAVRAQGGGVVNIRTARLTQAEAQALGYQNDRGGSGDVAMIEVSDNGPGIPPDVMKNIFVPFFTTKAVGEGTGLGLATVYGVVKQADGWIHVESPPGHGATFRIFLPVHVPVEGAEPAPAAAPTQRPPARDLSGAGRILFVEDEDAVRIVAARLLRARGYEVIEACDGEEALLLAEEHAGQIDLLISDVIMPGIDGPTLLKKARVFLGSAPVMFISGYAEAEFSDLLEDEKGVTFLPKPIDIKTLAERVKQQLAA
ncbi:MAG TPA: ATP-binding protein [Caulobacteraceae bacterium]|jgi:two-component system cell cycle sensor histidine kinase/response regulator CckA